MKKGNNEYLAAKPMIWVKDKEGNTYMCPKASVRDLEHVTERELRECVDESNNPQNN